MSALSKIHLNAKSRQSRNRACQDRARGEHGHHPDSGACDRHQNGGNSHVTLHPLSLSCLSRRRRVATIQPATSGLMAPATHYPRHTATSTPGGVRLQATQASKLRFAHHAPHASYRVVAHRLIAWCHPGRQTFVSDPPMAMVQAGNRRRQSWRPSSCVRAGRRSHQASSPWFPRSPRGRDLAQTRPEALRRHLSSTAAHDCYATSALR